MEVQTDLFLDFGEEKPSASVPKNRKRTTSKKSEAKQDKHTDTEISKVKQVETSTMPTQEKRKTYTTEEIMKSSVEYFHGDELAANVWMNKYALRDGNDIFELNPDMMHHRLASEF